MRSVVDHASDQASVSAGTPPAPVESADAANKPVGQSTSTARPTQANGSRTAEALPALGQPAAARPWEGADAHEAPRSSEPPAAAAPTATAAMLASPQSAAPVTASATPEQSRQSAASVAARAAQASTLSAHATAGLPLTPPSLTLGPAAQAAHGSEASWAPTDTDNDRVAEKQPWPAKAPSSTSGMGDGKEPCNDHQPAATRSDGGASSGSVEEAAADHVNRAEARQGGALGGSAPSPKPHAEPPTAEQAANPEGQPVNGQDWDLQADEQSNPVADEAAGLEWFARATSHEQSLERNPAAARADIRYAVALATILHDRSRPQQFLFVLTASSGNLDNG